MSEWCSIIVPVYNREKLLPECLSSILNQTYRPIELIIVNDGSTDNSEYTILDFKEKNESADFKIEYIVQANKGAPSARNNGLRNAKGEYILFLDSDDLISPSKISDAVLAYNNDKDLDLVYSGWFVSNQFGKSKNIGPDLETKPFVAEVVLRYLWTSAPLYKKTVLDKTGFWNESLTRAQDREYCARVMQHVKKAKRNNTFDCEYRQFVADNSITSTGHKPNPKHPMSGWLANNVMRDLVIKENHPDLLPKVLLSLAKRDLRDARRALACGANSLTRKIIKSNPEVFKIGFKNTILTITYWLISWVPSFLLVPVIQKVTRFKMKYLLKQP